MTPTAAQERLLDQLVGRCDFPATPAQVTVALSGGPDSAALVALARHAGLLVTAVHVHHGLRSTADADAAAANRIAAHLGATFRLERADVADGPDLEARARAARRAILGPNAMTGHTLDDQAETVLLAMLRGSGLTGIAGMRPGHVHPILALRRTETHAVCEALGLDPIVDPTNASPRFRRNRVRREVLPLLDDVAQRDVAPLLDRLAAHARADDDLLGSLAAEIDPTDVAALRSAPAPLARRALRTWLAIDGYPPDAAAIERVMAVVRHDAEGCDVDRGRHVTRSGGRLRLT
ncbi:MAG: tRNA lysidine(34) synthetase TilS [Actinomycetota bacterium]